MHASLRPRPARFTPPPARKTGGGHTLKWLPAAIASSLLMACSHQPMQQSATEMPLQVTRNASAEQSAAPATRPFPIDTFYTLLVAEVAGNREQFDLALANYFYQAERTQDAGVAARATRIARYLNARKAALRSAKLWAELEPDSPEAQLAATAELTLAGELDTALQHAEKALALGGNAPLQSLAATAVSNTELAVKVMPAFRRLSELYPSNPEASLALGMLLRASKRYEEALSITRKVQEQYPDLLDAPLLESHILVDTGKREQARQLLENLVDLYPQESRLRLQYARLLIREDLQLAQQQFAELVEQRPNDGNIILSLALIHFETGNLEEAKPLFSRLVDLAQHESAAHFYLGNIAEQESNPKQAVAHYRSVRPGNDYVKAVTRGTELLTATGNTKEASAWFSELRERHAGQQEQFYLLEAELLNKYDFQQEALALLTNALKEHPDSGRLIYAHALASEQQGDTENFEIGLRKLLSKDPDNATLLNTLGYKLTSFDDRLPEALVLIDKALQLRPDDPAIIDSMGWVQHRMGNHQKAVEYLQKALELLKDHEIAAHLGEALWAQGERQQAMQVLQQGLEINPESKIIPAAMQRLQDKQHLEQHVTES